MVGAGLAGLTAAYELDRAGWRVTVLEARDRVGGRVRTLREPLGGGQHAELGGEFIDRVHATILGYAAGFGLGLENTDRGWDGLANGLYVNGRLTRRATAIGPADRAQMDRFWQQVGALGRALARDHSERALLALDRRSVAGLLDQLGTDGLARLILDDYVRDEYGAPAERASLLNFVSSEAAYSSVPDSAIEVYRIEGGNDLLPAAFAERLGDAIRLRTPVTGIEQRAGGVRLSADGETVEADYAILAAPLPALRAIEFDPPLPTPLREAIAEAQYATVAKTVVQYGERVWREGGWTGDFVTDLPLVRTWEATDQQPGRAGVLIDYAAADRSRRFERLSGRERIATATAGIDELLPGSARQAGAGGSAAWAAEPYSGGCWISYAPGQTTRFAPALRRTYGRLHLAGEHTDAFAGYMEGAVRSGMRAARRLNARTSSSGAA